MTYSMAQRLYVFPLVLYLFQAVALSIQTEAQALCAVNCPNRYPCSWAVVCAACRADLTLAAGAVKVDCATEFQLAVLKICSAVFKRCGEPFHW
jgi:LSD1 subclass zinc finger protein